MTFDFSDLIYEYWNDNIQMYMNLATPSGLFIMTDTSLEFTNPSSSDIAVVSVAYSYFKSGNYILLSPTVFAPIK